MSSESEMPPSASPSIEAPTLRVAGLTKIYRIYERPIDRLLQMLFGDERGRHADFPALTEVGFEMRCGETVAIVGRNGSGKSTLLQILAGTMSPTSGEVEIRGRVAALLELGAGFNPEFNGIENARLCMQIYGLTREQIDERIAKVVEFADIGDYIDRPLSTYSSGMFMRLAFSVVANVDADVLIIDEALAVGDAYFVQKCMRFLSDFRKAGGSLLFVSHDMGAVKALCDRAIWLERGRVVADGSPDAIAKRYLEAMYTGTVSEAREERPTATGSSPTSMPPASVVEHGVDGKQAQWSPVSIVLDHAPKEGFGEGGARIERVCILDAAGRPAIDFSGGESVVVRVEFTALRDLSDVIVGFFLKDRRGQALFGDNTYMTFADSPKRVDDGERWSAEFAFRMPILPAGEYAVTAAVAQGTQQDHRILHWLHDAMILISHSRMVPTGLVGIPMRDIRLGPAAERDD